jgi:hypothetical protein
MRSFEKAFRIPAGHRLEQIKTRDCGGVVRGTYWEHNEYDAAGCLVARYHSFVELSDGGKYRYGWRKYNGHGHLIDTIDRTSARTKTLFDDA